MVTLDGTIESRVYLGVSTQITVSLGDGASLVALEQALAPRPRRRPLGAGDEGQDRLAPRALPGAR